MVRNLLITLCILAIASINIAALPPSFTLHGGIGTTVSPDNSIHFLQFGGLGTYRKPFETGGYMHVRSTATINQVFAPYTHFRDTETLNMTFSIPAGRFEMRANAELRSVVSESLLQPRWEAQFATPLISDSTQARVVYKGHSHISPANTNDTSDHTVTLGFQHEPSIRRAFGLHISGNWEIVHGAQAPLDATNLEIGGKIGGLIGYFTIWDAYVNSEYRLTRLDGSIITHTGGVSFGTSPIRQVGIDAGFDVEHAYYAESTDQSIFAGGSLRADYSPNNYIFFVIDFGGGRTISRNPELAGWSSTVKTGVEFSF